MSVARSPLPHFYSVIPAGGVGSRLWPLSRADEPKFLLDLTGAGKSLLRSTWDRLMPLTGPERTFVVTGYTHRHAVETQLPELQSANKFLEPSPRDSTAAICMAAALIERRDPDAIIGSFPADHLIVNDREFRRVVRQGIRAAEMGYLATIGIRPSGPSVAFGYIQSDGLVDESVSEEIFHATGFVEKPDEKTARAFLESGNYWWNAGMFIGRASLFREQLAKTHPRMEQGIRHIADEWGSVARYKTKDREWASLDKVAIDYAIAEPSAAEGRVAVIPGDFGWDDVGDFAAVARHIRDNSIGDLAILGSDARVISDGTSGIVVGNTKRVIALIGMKDIIVVDTPDALLVTDSSNAQRIKGIVGALRDGGNGDVL